MALERTVTFTNDEAAADSFVVSTVVDDERYAVAAEFARGGLGRVFEARDRRLDRQVAIKELITSNGALRERFRREVAITARLQHPAIVPVYDAGTRANGEPYYVMKLVSGARTLKEVVAAAPALSQRLAILPSVIAVGDAIAYAHSVGIIHRDLKPSNVLAGPFGETIVIDWGLAKDLGHSGQPEVVDEGPYRMSTPDVTRAGSVVGTPQFMAPEQARGEKVDKRTDVYALGALLYYVLAGTPPFSGSVVGEVLERVKHEQPRPLAERESGIPRDLIAIVEKALASDPAARYADAQGFVDDLRRFETGQLVAAHDYSTLQLVWRWLRRHRTAVALSAFFTVLLGVSGVLAFRQVMRERDRANARGNRLLIGQAKSLLATDPTAAIGWLKLYPPDGKDLDLVRAIAADAEHRGVARHVLVGHRDNIFRTAISADGTLLATASFDKTVRLWRLDSGALVSVFQFPSQLFAVRFSADGRLLAAAGEDGAICVWDLESGQATSLKDGSSTVRGLVFHDRGNRLASWALDGTMLDWSWRAGTSTRLPSATNAAPSPDERRLASIGRDGTVSVEDEATGARALLGRHAGADNLAWSADEQHLATVSDASITVWDLRSGRHQDFTQVAPTGWLVGLSADGHWLAAIDHAKTIHVWDLGNHSERLFSFTGSLPFALTFSPRASQLAVGDTTGRIVVYDLDSGSKRELVGHESTIHQLAFTRDGSILASASADHTVRLWDFSSAPEAVLRAHGSTVLQALYSPDSSRLATSSSDGGVIVWDAATNAPLLRKPHQRLVKELAFASDGHALASASWDKSARVWALTTQATLSFRASANVQRVAFVAGDDAIVFGGPDGKLWLGELRTGGERLLAQHEGAINAIAAPRFRRLVASASEDGTIRVVPVDGGATVVLRHDRAVNQIAFEPDGIGLFSSDSDGALRLWNVEGGASRLLRRQPSPIRTMAVSADGKLVATAGEHGEIWLTHVDSGDSTVLRGHASDVFRLAFSADGVMLASSAGDATVRLWNLSSGATAVLSSDGAEIKALGFSPDGTRFATGDSDATVRVWKRSSIRFVAGGTGWAPLRRWLDDATDLTISPRASQDVK